MRLIVTLLLLLVLCVRAEAREIRLQPGGSGDFPTIMDAVRAAEPTDTITLAPGTYHGTGNRNIDFLGKDLVVRAEPESRGACIIDCESKGRAFHLHSYETESSRVIGLTLSNGLADRGGAVLMEEHARTQFIDCLFLENRAAERAGAVAISSSLAQFTGCTFIGNEAGEQGGVAFLCCCSGPWFLQCTFADNVAPSGSVFTCIGLSTLHLDRCILAFNGPGEAVECRAKSMSCDPRVRETDIFGNVGGDWKGCLEELATVDGNLHLDPLFVEPRSPRCDLAADSPCRTAEGALGAP